MEKSGDCSRGTHLLEGDLNSGIAQAQQNADHADHDAEEQAHLNASNQTHDQTARPAEEVLFVGAPQLLDGRQVNLVSRNIAKIYIYCRVSL